MHIDQKIEILLNKYTAGTCTTEELNELASYASTDIYDDILRQHVLNNLENADLKGEDLNDEQSDAILQKIFISIKEQRPITAKLSVKKTVTRVAIAASFIAAIFIGIQYLLPQKPNYLLTNISTLNGDAKHMPNSSDRALRIQLEDGSIVMLQPGAELVYPKHFALNDRKVYLSGEAFFEISKNAKRPFYVYHENLITRVLGTSFNISYNAKNNKAEVEVSTGKVQVYENVKYNSAGNAARGVIILPNQKVVYTEDQKIFNKSLVDQPLPILRNDDASKHVNFEFESSPLTKIIPLLQDTYGVSIKIENENFRQCLFTGDLSDQNLFIKLDILCKAVNASYEVIGTEIVIKGKGCN